MIISVNNDDILEDDTNTHPKCIDSGLNQDGNVVTVWKSGKNYQVNLIQTDGNEETITHEIKPYEVIF